MNCLNCTAPCQGSLCDRCVAREQSAAEWAESYVPAPIADTPPPPTFVAVSYSARTGRVVWPAGWCAWCEATRGEHSHVPGKRWAGFFRRRVA